MTDSTIQDRIAARIARVAGARDQVIRTLIIDLQASIVCAEALQNPVNPLERRALEVLERVFPAHVAPGTLDDPRLAAHPVAQANAASWPKSKRRRKPTRAEKIAASKAGA